MTRLIHRSVLKNFVPVTLAMLFLSASLAAPVDAFKCTRGVHGTLAGGTLKSENWKRNFQQSDLPRPLPPSIYIPSFKGAVTQLKFYESGKSGVAHAERNYQNSFSSISSRFIYWELNLSHPAPGRRVDFTVDAVWYAPDGSEFARHAINTQLQNTWTSSHHTSGRGRREPGHWQPGTYLVLISVNGKRVTRGSFSITGGGGTTTTEAYDIPSLKANVTSIKFYEGGFDGVPSGQRVYQIAFASKNARAIFWELNLSFPAPGRKLDFAVDAVWHAPDGSEFARYTANYHLRDTWTSSHHVHGRGWREPGHWKPGPYRVELYIQGKQIGTGAFTIRGK